MARDLLVNYPGHPNWRLLQRGNKPPSIYKPGQHNGPDNRRNQVASPSGFGRGLPNRNSLTPRQQRIVQGSTLRAQRAQQRADLPGNSAAPSSASPKQLSPERIQKLTERLKGLRTERRGLPAPAIGSVTPGTPTRQDEIYKSIRQIRGKLGGRRNTPMPTPQPGTPPPGTPSPGVVPGTHIPTGDLGIPGVPGSYPPRPTPTVPATPGKPRNVGRPGGIRARVNGYTGRPIGR